MKMKEGGNQDAESGMCSVAYYAFSVIVDLLMTGPSHIQHSRQGGRMAEALQYEKTDKDRNTIRCFKAGTAHPTQKSHQAKKQCIDTSVAAASSDDEDCDYQETKPVESESTSPSESDCVSNAEVGLLSDTCNKLPAGCRHAAI